MKYYLILFFAILFFSCQQKQEKVIDSINVLYYNSIFERAMAVGCDEIIYEPENIQPKEFLEDGTEVPMEAVILDTTITDKKVLQEITTELAKKEKVTDDYMDARMKCYITFNNGDVDSLCIGAISVYGNYNNEPVKLSNKFVYLIRENCGFYKWIYIRDVRSFEELNDTTFVRDKVKSSTGEEY